MKQALFKLNKSGDGTETPAAIETTDVVIGDKKNNNSKFPSKSEEVSESNRESMNMNMNMNDCSRESATSSSDLPVITTELEEGQHHAGIEECSTKSSTTKVNTSNLPDLSSDTDTTTYYPSSTDVTKSDTSMPMTMPTSMPMPTSMSMPMPISMTMPISKPSNPIAAAASAAAAAAAVALSSEQSSSSTINLDRNNSPKNKGGGTTRRRGKWTIEEEEYVARVIQDFNSGFLNAPAGYTLRSYLSDKLQCDPMRITKKFTGESCIGKRVFHPAVRSAANSGAIDKAQTELDALETRWRRRLEMQQRESAKKAAASAAAATAANRGGVTVQGVPVSMLGVSSQSSSDSLVTQAASWLDRANVILMGNIDNETKSSSSIRGGISNDYSQRQNKDESTHSSAEDSLENQMKEVQRLIYEGPVIQQTTAGLPNLLLQTTATAATDQTQISDTIVAASTTSNTGTTSITSPSAYVSPILEPADKRLRTTDSNTTGAEDAEALVGFLRSVRASAAAGQEL